MFWDLICKNSQIKLLVCTQFWWICDFLQLFRLWGCQQPKHQLHLDSRVNRRLKGKQNAVGGQTFMYKHVYVNIYIYIHRNTVYNSIQMYVYMIFCTHKYYVNMIDVDVFVSTQYKLLWIHTVSKTFPDLAYVSIIRGRFPPEISSMFSARTWRSNESTVLDRLQSTQSFDVKQICL